MSDFTLINCYLQNSKANVGGGSGGKNILLCNYYLPILHSSSSNMNMKEFIQLIYDYFPYENNYFYFRLKIIGSLLGWKGDSNYYWLDFASIVNNEIPWESLVSSDSSSSSSSSSSSIDLQLTLLDDIAVEGNEFDYDTVILPEQYEEYLEAIQTEESIFHREEFSFPNASSSIVSSTKRYTEQSSRPTTSTSGPSRYEERPEDAFGEAASFSDYPAQTNQNRGANNSSSSFSASAASATPNININAMKKGVSSLWKTMKATADKLQSTVIQATSSGGIGNLSPQTQENLNHLSELVHTDFDYQNPFHLHLLQEVWKHSLQPLVSEDFPSSPDADGSYSSIHWKQAGWQNTNIVKDLKTTGLLALQSLYYFSQQYSDQVITLLQENRANIKTNYPFAIVVINLTLLLIELFHLRDQKFREVNAEYWEIFDQENHFYEIFVMSFLHLNQAWRQRQANRSQFGAMINEVKTMLINIIKQSPKSFRQFQQLASQEGFAL